MSLKKTVILGSGYAVPEKIVTNEDLSKLVDTSDEWIKTRTGIHERRIAGPNEKNSDLAVRAAKKALLAAELEPEDLDLIIVSTITPDMIFPATACLVQTALGAKDAATFDLQAACSGFIYGLSVARQYIAGGEYKKILVVASELLSRVTDWEDRSTCVLFGDGAGAVVLGASESGESDFLSFHLGGDGRYGDILFIPAGGSNKPASHETVDAREHFMKMSGPEVFKAAVKKMNYSMKAALEKAGLESNKLDIVIPHQANLRIIESLRKYLDLPEDKVYVNLQKYGNTSAASIAIALGELIESKKLRRGQLVGLCAFGGGLTWASSIFRF